MGTLRREKESAERAGHGAAELAAMPKRVKMDAEEAEPELRLKALQMELTAQPGRHEIEIVDVFKEPKLAPPPVRMVVGTLSRTQAALQVLGLEVAAP
ncbi:MAG TPA: hypothetical protein VLS47_09610 [Gallionella sp.]|nr:hypothetical protein [Gallionella sp.]